MSNKSEGNVTTNDLNDSSKLIKSFVNSSTSSSLSSSSFSIPTKHVTNLNGASFFTHDPVELRDDPASLDLVKRIAATVRSSCEQGLQNFLETNGISNCQKLAAMQREALRYLNYIDQLIGKEDLEYNTVAMTKKDKKNGIMTMMMIHNNNNNNNNMNMNKNSKSLFVPQSNYKFLDEQLIELFQELEWIAAIPPQHKLLISARKYQDVSTMFQYGWTTLARTFLFKGENLSRATEFIYSKIDAGIVRLKAWDENRYLYQTELNTNINNCKQIKEEEKE